MPKLIRLKPRLNKVSKCSFVVLSGCASKLNSASAAIEELAKIVSNSLEKEDMLILKNHGVIAIGIDLDEAAILAEFVESSAKTSFVARILSREPILTHLMHSR